MKSIKYGIMLLAAFASFSSFDEHDFLKEEPLDFYSPADQRQRLSGHRYQIYRHRHIRQSLDDNQQSAAQHQEFPSRNY